MCRREKYCGGETSPRRANVGTAAALGCPGECSSPGFSFVRPCTQERAGLRPARPKSPYCTVTLRFTDLSPAVEAVMVTVPVFGPVVYCAAAVPFEPVTTEVATKVPPAPLSVKFMVTPGTAKPFASTTFTTKGAASGALGGAVWLFPETLLMRPGAPAVLVSLNKALA